MKKGEHIRAPRLAGCRFYLAGVGHRVRSMAHADTHARGLVPLGGDITTVVEARHPRTGKVIELAEVNLTASGLLILITDTDGNQALIHRFAWDGLVTAVAALFAEEEREAQAWIATYPDPE